MDLSLKKTERANRHMGKSSTSLIREMRVKATGDTTSDLSRRRGDPERQRVLVWREPSRTAAGGDTVQPPHGLVWGSLQNSERNPHGVQQPHFWRLSRIIKSGP